MALAVPGLDGGDDDPYLGLAIDGRFELTRRLGQGAMGMVYLAQNLQPDEDCRDDLLAVKLVLDADKKPDYVARFKREILATSFFSHPNCVQIFAAGPTGDGAFFMALEYVRGEELHQILKRDGPLQPVRAFDLIIQLLEGLSAPHNANILHKDIKPENIMITDRGGQEFVKLMDFGLARILDNEAFKDQIYTTMEGQISGSPAYMAPEIITQDRIGPFTDIYSVGITLFELLTGDQPYGAKGVREHIASHLYKEPRKLLEVNPNLKIPDSVRELIFHMLEKAPSKRIKSCEEALAFIREKIEPELLR